MPPMKPWPLSLALMPCDAFVKYSRIELPRVGIDDAQEALAPEVSADAL